MTRRARNTAPPPADLRCLAVLAALAGTLAACSAMPAPAPARETFTVRGDAETGGALQAALLRLKPAELNKLTATLFPKGDTAVLGGSKIADGEGGNLSILLVSRSMLATPGQATGGLPKRLKACRRRHNQDKRAYVKRAKRIARIKKRNLRRRRPMRVPSPLADPAEAYGACVYDAYQGQDADYYAAQEGVLCSELFVVATHFDAVGNPGEVREQRVSRYSCGEVSDIAWRVTDLDSDSRAEIIVRFKKLEPPDIGRGEDEAYQAPSTTELTVLGIPDMNPQVTLVVRRTWIEDGLEYRDQWSYKWRDIDRDGHMDLVFKGSSEQCDPQRPKPDGCELTKHKNEVLLYRPESDEYKGRPRPSLPRLPQTTRSE